MDSSGEMSESTSKENSVSSSSAQTETNSSTSLTASETKLSENESESAQTAEDEQPQAYEGVSAADFQEFAEQVTPAIQGGAAALFVLVWALFFLAGIMSVQTLIRSLE